jgi:hypothetical protein
MDTSYTVFTHLLGPDNEILGQQDNLPQGGAFPTTEWQVGQVVADEYHLLLDPTTLPGRYPLEIGMYRAEDVTRLPVIDETGKRLDHDRILLPEISVVPATTPVPMMPGPVQRVYLPVVGIRN